MIGQHGQPGLSFTLLDESQFANIGESKAHHQPDETMNAESPVLHSRLRNLVQCPHCDKLPEVAPIRS